MDDKVVSRKLLYGLYIFVFILYAIFFLIFYAIIISPSSDYSYLLFYFIINGLYNLYPLLLLPLMIIIGIVIGSIEENRPLVRKKLITRSVIPLVIIVIFILIYFLLNWMIPTYRIIIYGGNGFD